MTHLINSRRVIELDKEILDGLFSRIHRYFETVRGNVAFGKLRYRLRKASSFEERQSFAKRKGKQRYEERKGTEERGQVREISGEIVTTNRDRI